MKALIYGFVRKDFLYLRRSSILVSERFPIGSGKIKSSFLKIILK
jgi:hypothetical protein